VSIWRPHTTGILIGGLVAILVALVASFMLNHFQPTTEVKLGSGLYNLRVASDEAARSKGLSGTTKLGPAEGLLMVFETDGNWGIWMKDMKVPIDIIWLDKDKTVVYMVTDASPQLSTDKKFIPISPARYVVELPAGAIQKAGIKIGAKAEFSLGGTAK